MLGVGVIGGYREGDVVKRDAHALVIQKELYCVLRTYCEQKIYFVPLVLTVYYDGWMDGIYILRVMYECGYW